MGMGHHRWAWTTIDGHGPPQHANGYTTIVKGNFAFKTQHKVCARGPFLKNEQEEEEEQQQQEITSL